MLIKPHIFRVRLFDRWWYGYAIAGRPPTLAQSVTQLQEWFGPNQPGWREPPKTWSSHYWRYLETHQGKTELVRMDHLTGENWSSQPGWFWCPTQNGKGPVLCRYSPVERGIRRAPSDAEWLSQQRLFPANGSISATRLLPVATT